MTTQQFISFIQLCAENHPAIQHRGKTHPDVLAGTTPKNIRFSTDGENVFAQASGSGNLKVREFCIVITPTQFDINRQRNNAQVKNIMSLNFEVCKFCDPADTDAQNLAQTTAQAIAQHIINEIEYYQFNNIAPFSRNTKLLDNVNGSVTAGGSNNLYGYRAELPFSSPVFGGESHVPFTFNP